MSKRINLTDFEREQLIKGLEYLKKETHLSYEVIRVGQRFYNQLINKLETEPSISKVSASSVKPSITQGPKERV